MHRAGEDVRPVGKDARRPVALMNITIEDQDGSRRALLDQAGRAVGEIIEHAISGAMGKMGVMRAAGGMAGQTEFKRLARRQQRAVHRKEGPVGQNPAPFQAKRADGVGIERAVGNRVDISLVLRAQQIGTACRFRLHAGELPVDPVLGKPPHQRRKFGRREPVSLGKRNIIIGVGNKRQHRAHGNSQKNQSAGCGGRGGKRQWLPGRDCSAGLPCQKLAEMLDPVTMRGEVRLPGKIVGLAVGRW